MGSLEKSSFFSFYGRLSLAVTGGGGGDRRYGPKEANDSVQTFIKNAQTIDLILPVLSASCERSFSALKIIGNHKIV